MTPAVCGLPGLAAPARLMVETAPPAPEVLAGLGSRRPRGCPGEQGCGKGHMDKEMQMVQARRTRPPRAPRAGADKCAAPWGSLINL